MNAVMLWKEYRQQRSSWIAVTILAIVLVEGLLVFIGVRREWQSNYQSIEFMPALVIAGTVLAYGIIAGATLLSNDKEDGTLTFLDNLTGRRAPLWSSKLRAGILLTLSQGLIMAAFFVTRKVGPWPAALVLPLLSLVALAWGLLGGALCRHVLTAVLTATALMVGFMTLCYSLTTNFRAAAPLFYAALIGIPVAVAFTARRIYCRDDRSRLAAPRPTRVSPWPSLMEGRFVICWLIYRQGRWIFLGVAAGAVVLATTANLAPLILWPIGTLVLGIACGLAVFCPEQRSGRLFWATQGLPRGRIWNAKVIVWMVLLAGVLTLTWYEITEIAKSTLATENHQAQQKLRSGFVHFSPSDWLGVWQRVNPNRGLDPLLWLTLWPIYGFSIALFCGQVVRRTVMALVLSVFIAPAVLALWLPSFLIGGLPLWQVAIIPLLLLLTTRLAQRPWISDRLWDARPLAGIVFASTLMTCWLAGCLWYRAIEVPDVGEPFDVSGFLATLPTSEQNKSGILIRDALTKLRGQLREADTRFGPEFENEKSNLRAGMATGNQSYFRRLLDQETHEKEWSKQEPEIGEWVNELFRSPWYADLRQAAALPLGVVEDVRIGRSSLFSDQIVPDARDLAKLVKLRALQLESRGDPEGTLGLLETMLGVSRQLENKAPLAGFFAGFALESLVLQQGLDSWLQSVGSDKALLKAAGVILQKHDALVPDAANAVKAQYLIDRDSDPFADLGTSLDVALRRFAAQIPWENQRQRRVLNAIARGAIFSVQQPFSAQRRPPYNSFSDVARMVGLPPRNGPGSNLSAEDWGAFVFQTWPENQYYNIEKMSRLRAANLVMAQAHVAVRLYQADHGRLPANFQDLVPDYLPALPRDPDTGSPCWIELEETPPLATSVLATSLAGMGVPFGQAYLRLASALVVMSERVAVDVGPTEGGDLPGTAGGAGGGMAAPVAAAGGAPGYIGAASPGGAAMAGRAAPTEEGFGSRPLPPLMPHAVIHIGNYSREVPLPAKR